MAKKALPRRPSNELEELVQQLLQALARLKKARSGTDEADLYLAYLDHAQALAWRGVAQRRPAVPREVLDRLLAAQPFIDSYLPEDDSDPRVEAARNLSFVFRSFYLADEALEESRVESVLADRERSLTEREVLRVLSANPERYLRRGEVQKLLKLLKRPTPARVGQILVQLDAEDLVVHMPGRAQGNPRTTFYALSPQGHEICRRLDLISQRKPYFSTKEEDWKVYVTAERITAPRRRPPEPGRIIAFWSHRGGVGRTTTVAGAALVWADRTRRAPEEKLLVADFDFEAPGLDVHFASRGLGACRGLRGLVVDYYRLSQNDRAPWLRQALQQVGEYILQPLPERCPNLFYLPTGFGPDGASDSDEERAEAWRRLEAEAQAEATGQRGESESVGTAFLPELRSALEEAYARVLLDPRTGMGLSAWAAILKLADALVLCIRPTEPDPRLLRAVMGNFLRRRAEDVGESASNVGVLFVPVRPGHEAELRSWVERHLLEVKPSRYGLTRRDQRYLIAVVGHEDQLAGRIEQSPYGPLVGEVLGAEASPVVLDKAVTCVYDQNTNFDWKRIAAGLLGNVRNRETTSLLRARVLPGYAPDEKTKKLVTSIQETWTFDAGAGGLGV